MATYFSVPHLGAGSPEIENLGCYFFRLAQAHGCSQWQLAAHLTAWWREHQGTALTQRYPFSVIGTPTMSICGYGEDVQRVVTALSSTTGIATLRAGTLLPLHEVAARTAIGTLRNRRGWCPACYEEDRQAGGPLYDRLLWVIAPIQRCAAHRIALFDACPFCRRAQLYAHRCVHLDRCSYCDSSLIGRPEQYVEMRRPTHGENLIYDLIAAVATDPTLTLRRLSMRSFYRTVRKDLPTTDPLRAVPSLGSVDMRPSLEMMLRMATAFNVSLLDFQGNEPPSTTLPLYSPSSLKLPVPRQGRVSKALRRLVKRALVRAIAGQKPLVPYRDFCKALHVSCSFTYQAFPDLTKQYQNRRRDEAETAREVRLNNAKRVAQLLIDKYRKGEITQKRQLQREIAKETGISVAMARQLTANRPSHPRGRRPRTK